MPSDPPTFRGTVVALDAATGAEAWRFHVTDEAAGEGAGVSVWSSPAVDRERGVLYIGTGQAYGLPAPARSDSLVALDLATGEEVWHRQFTAGDAWSVALPSGLDADVGAMPNLFTVGRHRRGRGRRQGRHLPGARPRQRRDPVGGPADARRAAGRRDGVGRRGRRAPCSSPPTTAARTPTSSPSTPTPATRCGGSGSRPTSPGRSPGRTGCCTSPTTRAASPPTTPPTAPACGPTRSPSPRRAASRSSTGRSTPGGAGGSPASPTTPTAG